MNNMHPSEGPRPLDNSADTAHFQSEPIDILQTPKKGKRLVETQKVRTRQLTAQQRLLILDIWNRSGLPAKDFSDLVGISPATLGCWKKKFEDHGPEGLIWGGKRKSKGSRLPEVTKRTILMLKENNPEWGCQRISDMLARGPALQASPQTVLRVLHEAGYVTEEVNTRPHKPKIQRFEREHSNQMWQTDLFTFVLKRQNRRVHLVAFMDDHSRFIVGWALHTSPSSAMVIDCVREAITNFGLPHELLTDNGPQYLSWRGKSAFRKEMEKQGIRHIVSRPRHPQTLGKVERFWKTLWAECLEKAIFLDLEDARGRLRHFVDYYNFQRTHQGIGGLVPADRYFGVASEIRQSMKERIAENALALAKEGIPREPFYLTGQVGGQPFSVHSQGERVILQKDGKRREVELVAPDDLATPGSSPLDQGMEVLREIERDLNGGDES